MPGNDRGCGSTSDRGAVATRPWRSRPSPGRMVRSHHRLPPPGDDRREHRDRPRRAGERGLQGAPGPGRPEESQDPRRRLGPPRPPGRPGRRSGRSGSRRWTRSCGGSTRPGRMVWRIESRPEGGSPLGIYATKKKGVDRPTLCRSSHPRRWTPSKPGAIAPTSSRIRWGFASTSLILLEHLYARPKVLKRTLAEGKGRPEPRRSGSDLGPDPAARRPGRLARPGEPGSAPKRREIAPKGPAGKSGRSGWFRAVDQTSSDRRRLVRGRPHRTAWSWWKTCSRWPLPSTARLERHRRSPPCSVTERDRLRQLEETGARLDPDSRGDRPA